MFYDVDGNSRPCYVIYDIIMFEVSILRTNIIFDICLSHNVIVIKTSSGIVSMESYYILSPKLKCFFFFGGGGASVPLPPCFHHWHICIQVGDLLVFYIG